MRKKRSTSMTAISSTHTIIFIIFSFITINISCSRAANAAPSQNEMQKAFSEAYTSLLIQSGLTAKHVCSSEFFQGERGCILRSQFGLIVKLRLSNFKKLSCESTKTNGTFHCKFTTLFDCEAAVPDKPANPASSALGCSSYAVANPASTDFSLKTDGWHMHWPLTQE